MKKLGTLAAVGCALIALSLVCFTPPAQAEGDAAAKAKPKPFTCSIIEASANGAKVKIHSRNKETNGTERQLAFSDKTKIKIDGQKATTSDLTAGLKASISAYSVDGDTYKVRSASFMSAEYIKAKRAAAKAKQAAKAQE